MSIKEIITYILGAAGLILMCYVRIRFTSRQQIQADNKYTEQEEKLYKFSIGILVLAVILALIPIY